jgi:phosphatidylserine/phosphatidylglycerophosphate/cardiolipin synthase-like enzyme
MITMVRTILLTVFVFTGATGLDGQVIFIRDARAKPVGTEVTLTGIVTCDVIAGPFLRFFQDPTGGMAVYDRNFAGSVQRGDSITVTGVLKDYQQLTELDPVRGYTIHSGGHDLPHPLLITPQQLHDSIQGMLVQIRKVVFGDAGGTFGTGSYPYTANGEKGIVYVDQDNALSGQAIPGGPVTMTGIASTYYANHQVLVRHPDDLVPEGSIWLTSPLTISHITTNGFDLEWTTNIRGSTQLQYGHTPDLELYPLEGNLDSTWHRISVSGTDPATLFYARAMSAAGTDTAFSEVKAYITRSSSSGVMRAFFNRPVDHSVATGMEAVFLDHSLDDTLAAYISRAGYSLDMAMYSFDDSGIGDITAALNTAHERGVKVRIVADHHTREQDRWKSLDPDIGIIFSPMENFGAGIGIMHNKFLVLDALSPDPDDPYVWTGSANITQDQLNYHANNVIIVQDRSLARVYQLEFEEMFGSSGPQPDTTRARFGLSKSDNTPHDLVIGGSPVECYFSPTDRVNQIIASRIGSADHEIYVNTMLITRDFLAEGIMERKDSGVISQVIINDENDPQDNDYVMDILKDLGEDFRQNGEGGILHHKVMIIDQAYPASDPLVLTGSHNWSSSADNRNDENTLIIHDDTLANLYYQEFSERFKNGAVIGNTFIHDLEQGVRPGIMIYPNPNRGRFTLVSPLRQEVPADLAILASDGSPVCTIKLRLIPGENTISLPSKPGPGMYILQLRHPGGVASFLFISQ